MAVAAPDAAAAPLEALFLAANDRRTVRRRMTLHRGGDAVHHLWLVAAGWFGRFRTGPTGIEAFTAVYLPGDVIALDALPTGQLGDEVAALMDATVFRLPIERLRAAAAADGATAAAVIRLLAAEAGFLREALIAVGSQTSTERLATFFLQTHERLVAAGQLAPGADRFHLPLTQTQLGAVTGLTSVHVNRVLKRLRAAELCDCQGGTARMIDLEGLQRVAQRRA